MKYNIDEKKGTQPIHLNNDIWGSEKPSLILGPCSVENTEQMQEIYEFMNKKNIKNIRGGAYKPRTSPYDFQGLGKEGLKLLSESKKEYDFNIVSEIMDPRDVQYAENHLDVIQIGSRNMQNFSLLKEVGMSQKPILLKRGLSSTIKEFINAAEYIYSAGNKNIILCERGIRTFETYTRNTLDISAVPILKQETPFPIMVDVTHSTGIKDLMIPCMKSAIAAGADVIMAEVHPNPTQALSDSKQQMDFKEANKFIEEFESFNKKIFD